MKFLHLSDLHIGKNVNGFSMIPDQKYIFAQIIELIQKEKPVAVVIAGDVYDRAIPSVDAVRLFDDFLTQIVAFDVAVLLISGNHDSPERISYASRLLVDKRVFFSGTFDGKPQKVTLIDEFGDVNFWLMPFIKPAMVRGAFTDIDESYDSIVSDAIDAAQVDFTARNVLVSHQFYTKIGLSPERSESELNPVGGLDAVDVGLVERFDYVALGHLHGAQSVGARHIRYCGSPLKYSFSEMAQKKAATLVELGDKGSLAVTTLPLMPLHDMREIRGDIDILLTEQVASLADRNDYLSVVLTNEGEIIDAHGKIRSVYPNMMNIKIENTHTSVDISTIEANVELVENLSTFDLFGEFFLTAQGTTMNTEQMEIVRNLLSEGDV